MPTNSPKPQVRTGIYCRISLDVEGEALGVQRQEEDCRRLAGQRGWNISDVYIDNSVSAFKRNKKRPEFERMLTDLEQGRLDAIVVYDLDRFTRQPRDLERLIDLFETKKNLLFAAVTGDIDLGSDNGVMMARFAVNIANKSSKDTGRRVKRKHLELAQKGIPVGGTRPFGYLDDLKTPHPVEAPLVRQAYADLLDGKRNMTQICRDWDELGVKSTRGLSFQRQTLKQLLLNPRYGGLRALRGVVVRDEAGEPVKGLWEPLVAPEIFWRAEALLKDARGVTGARPGKRKYLLSGIIRCSECGRTMTGNAAGQKNTFYYRCAAKTHGGCGKVSISGPKTEEMVANLVRAKLSGVKASKSTGWPDADQLSGKQERVAELMGAYTNGTLSGSVVFPAVESLEREISELRAREQAWTREHRQQAPATVEEWDDLNVDVRRALVGSVVQSVVAKPAVKAGGAFDRTRVDVVWRG